jgi:hypothetical protein
LEVATLKKSLYYEDNQHRPSVRAAKMLEEDRLREKAGLDDVFDMLEPEPPELFCKRYGAKLNYEYLRTDIGPRIDRFCNKRNAYLEFKRCSSVGHLLKKMDYQEEVQKRNITFARKQRIEKLKKLKEEQKRQREQAKSQSPNN